MFTQFSCVVFDLCVTVTSRCEWNSDIFWSQEYDIPDPEAAWCFASCANPFDFDPEVVPEIEDYFTAEFSRERIKMYGDFLISFSVYWEEFYLVLSVFLGQYLQIL